jgi:hypothetical protein
MTVPIAKHVTRWQCPYCDRTWSKRTVAALHIARCWYNPAARSCKSCDYYEPEQLADVETPPCAENCLAGVAFEPQNGRVLLPILCEKWASQGDEQ